MVITTARRARPRRGVRRGKLVAVVMGLAAFVPVGLSSFEDHHGLPVVDAHPHGSALRAAGCSAYRRAGFVVVKGAIQSSTPTVVRRVEVIAETVDREGTPLDRGSALVHSVDIGPGCASPFRIVVDSGDASTQVRVWTRPLQWDAMTPAWRNVHHSSP